MAGTRCEICGKAPVSAHQISHAHNVTKRRQYPNIQRMRALVGSVVKHLNVCTRCLRSGRIQKAAGPGTGSRAR